MDEPLSNLDAKLRVQLRNELKKMQRDFGTVSYTHLDVYKRQAISRRYDTFTRMEQNIADYVLEHGKDVLEMSISTLARECKVVESTIFRFCRTLGVSGYRDFRTALAVSLCAREQESDPPIADDDPVAIQVRHIYDSCLNALRETYQLLKPSLLDEAVRRLMLADRILVLGAGKSMVSTFGAYRQLMLAMPKVQCAFNAHEQRKLCAMVTARDAVILFVQSDAPAFLTDLARLVHSRGCYLILISPLAKMSLSVLADITLLCGGFGGAGTAVSAQAFLIELIYRLYPVSYTHLRCPICTAKT